MRERRELDDTSTLAALLSRYMTERGYTRSELSAKSRMSTTTLHRWLTGKSGRPYYRAGLHKVAAALALPKVSLNRLLRAAGVRPVDSQSTVGPEESELLSRWLPTAHINLPSNLTSFVGRAHEVTSIAEFLCNDDLRLVTLIGTGGVARRGWRRAENRLCPERSRTGALPCPTRSLT